MQIYKADYSPDWLFYFATLNPHSNVTITITVW